MSPLVYALLAFIAVGALGFALVPGVLGSNRAAQRRKALRGDFQATRRENAALRARDERRRSIQETLKSQADNYSRARKNVPLPIRIQQAGMKIKPRDFIRNQIILGVVIVAVTFLVQVPLVFAAVFGAAGGYMIPRLYLDRRRKKYQARFLEELPNAVEAIVRGVKSGLPLNDSMRLVAKEAKDPLKTEFQKVLDQQSLGKSMTEAIQVLYERIPVSEVNFFVVVITVQQQAGGNLSEALGNLAKVLRNRKAMKAKIKAMSSEAKASAGIIGALPFVVAGLVELVSPSYMIPLYSTGSGQIALAVAALMMGIGIFVMRQMIQFDF
jgi:tight adherence protein B